MINLFIFNCLSERGIRTLELSTLLLSCRMHVAYDGAAANDVISSQTVNWAEMELGAPTLVT